MIGEEEGSRVRMIHKSKEMVGRHNIWRSRGKVRVSIVREGTTSEVGNTIISQETPLQNQAGTYDHPTRLPDPRSQLFERLIQNEI